MKTTLHRRSILRGLCGTAVALPFLEAMLDNEAFAAGEIPKRYLVSLGGHSLGSDGPGRSPLTQFHIPSVVGPNYNLPQALAPLASVKQHVSVVSGLKIPSAYDNGGSVPAGGKVNNHHAYMASPLLTGVRGGSVGTIYPRGSSSEYVASAFLGAGSLYPVLSLCLQPSTYVATDSFFGMSWRLPTGQTGGLANPMGAQMSPRAAFNSLFSNFSGPNNAAILAQQKERSTRLLVVDRVKQSAAALSAKLGRADQRRVSDHLDQIRDLQNRIAAVEPVVTGACRKPTDPGADPSVGGVHAVVNGILAYNVNSGYSNEEARGNVMAELISLAFACDLTRSVAYQLTHFQCFLNMNSIINFPHDMHSLGHNAWEEPQSRAVAWHVKQFVKVVERLAAMPEGNGTILDNTAMVYLSEGGNGFSAEGNVQDSTHSTENMMALIAGHAGGLKGGVHVKADNQKHPANVLVSALKAVGMPQNNLGEVTGVMPGLL